MIGDITILYCTSAVARNYYYCFIIIIVLLLLLFYYYYYCFFLGGEGEGEGGQEDDVWHYCNVNYFLLQSILLMTSNAILEQVCLVDWSPQLYLCQWTSQRQGL